MIELYIARHGQTDLNKEGRYHGRMDASLNSDGITQARELAEKVSDLGVEVIYCSPLKRAMETASFIKLKCNREIIIVDNFIERAIGVYEGLTKEEAKDKYPDLYSRNITRIFNEAPPEGETVIQVKERVFFGLDQIKTQKDYSKIMIVAHGFVAKVVNSYFNPQLSEQEFFDFALGNAEIKKYTL